MAALRRHCSLPSHRSAVDFIKRPNAQTSKRLLGSYVGRTALLSLGFFVARRDFKESARSALIGATTIELFVLLHALEMIKDGRCS